jgi:hypothetical protein
LHHILVSDAQDAHSAGRQDAAAFGVILDLGIVRRSVHLHDQAGRVAVEIHDKAVNDLLAAKMEPRQAIRAQLTPEPLFGRRHATTQLFGSLDFCRGYLLTSNDFLNWHVGFLYLFGLSRPRSA